MTRHLILAALGATALGGLSADAAQAACGGEVRFDRGANHAAINGSLTGTETCDYTLRAAKGQVLSAALDAPDGVEVIVFDPIEHALVPGEPLVLPRDATYTVRVLQTRNAARANAGARAFALSVKIADAGSAAPAAKPAAPASAAAPAGKPPSPSSAATTCEGTGAVSGGRINLSGTLAGDGLCSYTLAGEAGRTVTLLLDAPAGVEVMLRAPGADTAEPLPPDAPVTLTASGEHAVLIARTRNDARQGGTRPFSAVVTVD